MLRFEEMRGAIFDLDDTLLDNGPADKPAEWLHSRSRLAAVHAIGKEQNIPELASLTAAENGRAFVEATVHSLPGAIWHIFYTKGLVASDEIDTANPIYALVQTIAARKNELHDSILRKFGREVPGASVFLRRLATNGLADQLAMATNAVERDIDIVLEAFGWADYFPPERIVSEAQVTRPKPDPQCFDLAFRTLGLPDSERRKVAAFEDNPRGLASAKAAGLFVCAITTRLSRGDPKLLAAEPDLIADSYDEFAELLHVPSQKS